MDVTYGWWRGRDQENDQGRGNGNENKGRRVSRFKRVVLHHFHTIITDDDTYIASPAQVLISCISTFLDHLLGRVLPSPQSASPGSSEHVYFTRYTPILHDDTISSLPQRMHPQE